MSKLFESLRVYAGKWNLKSEEKFDESDKALFTEAKVVSSEFGKSVCFHLKTGGVQYIPLSIQGVQPNVGELVDFDRMSIQVLEKQGENDIYRIKVD